MDAIDKINYILAEKGLTGADLERMIGVSNSVYSQWNTKTTKPSKRSLLKVADALGVSVAYLLGNDEQNEEPTLQMESELTKDHIRAIEKIKNMPPEELARKMAALEAVLNM